MQSGSVVAVMASGYSVAKWLQRGQVVAVWPNGCIEAKWLH